MLYFPLGTLLLIYFNRYGIGLCAFSKIDAITKTINNVINKGTKY